MRNPTPADSDLGFVLAVTRRILRTEELAADAAQDALLSAHRARGQFAGRSAYRTWLYRIATRAALSQLRVARRARLEPRATFDDVVAATPSPEDEAAAHELSDRVNAALADVPEGLRRAFVLRAQGHSEHGVARALGITVANVKIRTHRARERLRHALGREISTEPRIQRGRAGELQDSRALGGALPTCPCPGA